MKGADAGLHMEVTIFYILGHAQTPAFWLTEEWNLPKNVTLLSYASHCTQVNDRPLELLL